MKTKKYQIGGSTQSRTSSDELNPFKIKEPVAPNPSFVPSGSMNKMQTGGAKKTVKKVDDKTSWVDEFKAGFDGSLLEAVTTPIPQAYKAVGKMAKNVDDAIEKRYPNYTGPTSFYAGYKSGLKNFLGYKKGGQVKKSKKY